MPRPFTKKKSVRKEVSVKQEVMEEAWEHSLPSIPPQQ
jgi:hypothetical protein